MSEERPGMSGGRLGYVRGAARVCQGSGSGMTRERLGYVRGGGSVCRQGSGREHTPSTRILSRRSCGSERTTAVCGSVKFI